MPGPEGYRKALRLMKQAEKFRRPIFTFIDTAGAYPGLEAEERGQGEAIARNLFEMSRLTVPVIAVITGEGNSGGALALAVANRVLMLENAVYAILSPEGFASILWKDAQRSGEAAELMKLTAPELKKAGGHRWHRPGAGGRRADRPQPDAVESGPGADRLSGTLAEGKRRQPDGTALSEIPRPWSREGERMNGIKLRGTGRCVPANTVTNDDLSRLVDTNDEWITARTGIRSRYRCEKETLTELCVSAARDAPAHGRDHPGGHRRVHRGHRLGGYRGALCRLSAAAGAGSAGGYPCFDLNAACTGFVYALHTMECLLNASPGNSVWWWGRRPSVKLVDWTDRGTCILFGDGAAAAGGGVPGGVALHRGRAGRRGTTFSCVCRALAGESQTSCPWRGRRCSNSPWRPFPPAWTPR